MTLYKKINAIEDAINTICNCAELSLELRNEMYKSLHPTAGGESEEKKLTIDEMNHHG